MKLLVLSALAAFSIASPAAAHWEFTQWGMSPDEVAKAGGDRVVMLEIGTDMQRSGAACRAKLAAPYRVGSVEFHQGYFCFDKAGGLAEVVLFVQPGAMENVAVGLTMDYGPPVVDTDRVKSYASRAQEDSAILYSAPTSRLVYTPRPKGL